jgi:hypothetical protein
MSEDPLDLTSQLPGESLLCTAGKPLLMVIPAGGTTIPCPVHEDGHFVYGSPTLTC